MFNLTDPSSRLTRWKIKLAEYKFTIMHKAGASNTNADALSRISNNFAITRSQTKVDPKIVGTPKSSVEQKQTCSKNLKIAENMQNYIIQVSEASQIEKILKEFHMSPIGGHQGYHRTVKRIKEKYFWKNMLKDISNMIKTCELCQKHKASKLTKLPMAITSRASKPFEKIFLDIVEPITPSYNNNQYILTLQDDLTTFSAAIPLENTVAKTIAEALVTKFICHYGVPKTILTDQGSNFVGSVFKNICKFFKIEKLQTTAFHPQTNGALERSHRTLTEYLRNFTVHDISSWDDWIPYAMFTYNTTPHSSTNFTPFELVFGHKAELPASVFTQPDPVYNYEDYLTACRARLQSCQQIAKEKIIQNKLRSKSYYERNVYDQNFKKGDSVSTLYKNHMKKGKFGPFFNGLFQIIDTPSEFNSTILIKNKEKTVHNNDLKHFTE